MKFTDWMNKNVIDESTNYRISGPIKTKNGLTMSIQASGAHYCTPKMTTPSTDYDFYNSFEVGFLSEVIESLIEFAKDESNPTETVYCCVPKKLIEKIILENGGIKE